MFFFLLSGFYTLYVPVLLEAWQQALTGALYSLAVAAAATLFVAIRLPPLIPLSHPLGYPP